MTSPTLKICLMGAFAVEIEGEVMPPLFLKNQWLLALLTLRQGQEVSREWLAATLWPDSANPLFNLRQALSKDLRPKLGTAAAMLRTTPKSLCLDTSEVWVDVAAFDAAIKASKAASTDASRVAALEKAVGLYRGPLVEGCQEEWILGERTMREEAFHHALERLADAAHEGGKQGQAANYLRRLIASDPFRESAYRMLMETMAASGDTTGVQQVYRDLRRWLHRELHAEPSAETRALYKQLQQSSSQTALAARPSPPAPSRRLPLPLTRLIGRENDIAAVGERLHQGRLVTLIGSGGVGKTRLSLAVAEALAADFDDGVWFVELASLTNPDLVASAVAHALQIKEQAGQTMVETLVSALASRSLLLVLDNCEHLLEASAALIEHLLRWCEGVRALATSRHALGLAGGELLYPVPPLEVPPLSLVESGRDAEKNAVSRLREYDATHLFMERMAERDTARRLTAAEASAIAEICRHLEGIPLAIEMAAARVRTMSLEQIRASLSGRFGLLGLSVRSSHSRHKTLSALIDWSYRLLNEAEKTVLSRLSIFAGGWMQEAAEYVCAEERSSDPFSGSDVSDLLSSLVDQSLVAYEEWAGVGRYRLLETVRQYALNRLEESGESDAVRQRHRDCFLALVEAANVHLNGKEENAWLQRLDAENENLRAALNGCLEAGEAQRAQQFCGALDRFWQIRSYVTEGRMWCARALEAAGGQKWTVERAEALRCASHLAVRQGDASLAETLCKESLTIWQERKDERGIAQARMSLGTALFGLRRCAEARNLMEESLAAFRALGDRTRIIWALHNLGLVGREQGDYRTVSRWLKESLTIRRELGDRRGIALSLYALGENARNRGDYATAQRRCAESLPIFRELGDQPGLAAVLNLRGDLFMIQGDYGAATKPYQESLDLYQKLRFPHNIAWMLRNMGRLAFAECRYDAAHRALSEALATFPPNNELGVALSLIDLGHVIREQGDWHRARELFEQSAAILQTLEGRPCAALLRNSLGIVDMEHGQLHVAQTRFEEALALSQEVRDQGNIANSLKNLGYANHKLGDFAAAQVYFEKALASFQEIGSQSGIAYTLCGLGDVAYSQGDYGAARSYYEESMALLRTLGDRSGMAFALMHRGILAHSQEDYPSMWADYKASLILQREIGKQQGMIATLETLAGLVAKAGKTKQAAIVWGGSEALQEASGLSLLPGKEQETHDQAVAQARQAIGEEAFWMAWSLGKSVTFEQVIELAQQEFK